MVPPFIALLLRSAFFHFSQGLSIVNVAMDNGQELKLDQVHFVPRIKKSLLSVGQLDFWSNHQ